MADRLGGAPAVCTSGQPKLVTLELLRRLASAGALPQYYGDFDWPGVAMANRLIAEVGAEPLLMSASDYQAAARSGRQRWNSAGLRWRFLVPLLGPAMTHLGVAVHEEAVLDELLACLAPQAR